MTSSDVYDDEMPDDPRNWDDATVEAFLSGRAVRADQVGPLACFAEDLRVALHGPMPAARSDLATLLSTGFSPDNGDLAAMPGSAATGPARQAAGLPKWRKTRMLVSDLLSNAAAKAALAVAVATAGLVGAGAAGALPASAQHAVASVVSTVTPLQLPDPNGQSTGTTDGDGQATTPGPNAGGAAKGLDRANQTPAAGQAPTSVPGANTGGAAKGLDRANQTPAAGHAPTSVPGSNAGGVDKGQARVEDTPAGAHMTTTTAPSTTTTTKAETEGSDGSHGTGSGGGGSDHSNPAPGHTTTTASVGRS